MRIDTQRSIQLTPKKPLGRELSITKRKSIPEIGTQQTTKSTTSRLKDMTTTAEGRFDGAKTGAKIVIEPIENYMEKAKE